MTFFYWSLMVPARLVNFLSVLLLERRLFLRNGHDSQRVRESTFDLWAISDLQEEMFVKSVTFSSSSSS